jgi:protein-S-isoprenylcysteine O-methyltransferase Ste14
MWHGLWPDSAMFYLWCAWAITWIAASVWANRTVKRPGLGREWFYRLFAIAGFVFLLGGIVVQHNGHFELKYWSGPLGRIIWQPPVQIGWAIFGLACAGFLFAWWARLHLGRLWSGSIPRKEGHRVIDSGPYAVVRHPIYTGILAAATATAIDVGAVHSYIGAALMIFAYWTKAKLEERWLREELGPQDYDAYRRRVPMLVPFGPKAV